MRKKVILTTILFIIFSVMFVSGGTAFAEAAGDFTYTVDGGAATITGYSGPGGEVTIPESLGGYPVACIYENAFRNCTAITSVHIPNTVQRVYLAAFGGCSGLDTLHLPESVTELNTDNWYRIYIEDIHVDPDNPAYLSNDGVVFSKDKVTLILYPAGKTNRFYDVPGSVQTIGDSAFLGCSYLQEVFVPGSVTEIGYSAFSNCTGLLSMDIPSSVVSLNDAEFSGCTNLTSVSLHYGINSIGWRAFEDCSSLQKIIIPQSVTTIGLGAFSGCTGLTDIRIPCSVTYFDSSVFYGCSSLRRVTVPQSVQAINECNFKSCTSLESVTFLGDTSLQAACEAFNECPNISAFYFYGNAPDAMDQTIFNGVADGFVIYYIDGKSGWTTPTWNGYPAAEWSGREHTVAFDSRGGSSVAPQTVAEGEKLAKPEDPVNGNSIFHGWYMEPECINPWIFAMDEVTGSITLYAKWISSSYTVGFDAQGGSAVGGMTAEYDSTIAAPIPPIWPHHLFLGWYKETDCLDEWSFAHDRVTEDITLYARWTDASFTINFDSQGGSPVGSVTADYDTLIIEPAVPTLVDCAFNGWYKEPDCIHPWNFASETVTEDITLYAKWGPVCYTVTFDARGGTPVDSVTAEKDALIADPGEPTLTGHDFLGWYKETACVNIWNFNVDRVVADMMLYAKWESVSYTVSFDSRGGSSVGSVTAEYDTYVSEPAAPTLAGNDFQGWYKEAACVNRWNFNVDRVVADTTLYAKWSPASYTVVFDSQGGTAVESIETGYNTLIEKPQNPALNDLFFTGWYKEPSCIHIWDFNTDRVTEDITLYAMWEILVDSVTASTADGSEVVRLGGPVEMVATVLPGDATIKTVAWSVVNGTGSASIDQNGILTGLSEGTVTVWAVSNGTGAVSDSCEVTVMNFAGAGTEEDPYLIENADDLAKLAFFVNDGDSPMAGKYYLQTQDIDLSGFGNWTPIGGLELLSDKAFHGVYDGDNRRISGMTVSMQAADSVYAGLFGQSDGVIRNVTLDGGSVDVAVTGEGGHAYVGGIVGYMHHGELVGCSSSGSVSVSSDQTAYLGGLAGRAYWDSTISKCSFFGSVDASTTNQACVGGIVGVLYDNVQISSCMNTGSVHAEGGTTRTGGIVGWANGGDTTCSITGCVNTGAISQVCTGSYYSYAAGIVGYLSGSTIDDSFNVGDITSSPRDTAFHIGAGGVVGGIMNANCRVRNCYNTGNVSGREAGAIAAYIYTTGSYLANCYYLDNNPLGVGGGQNDVAYSKTDAEMRLPETFEGFDFDNVWTVSADVQAETHYFLPQLRETLYYPPYSEVQVQLNDEDAGEVTGAGHFALRDSVALTATPNPYYEFAKWEVLSGGIEIADVSDPSLGFAMPSTAVTVRANFEKVK